MSLALGLGLGPSYGGGIAFSPLSLFAAGEAGFWYDPGTISTLFQDAAGTTAVAAAADPDGLVLDRSKSLVLGSELVTNGDFSAGTTGYSTSNSGTLSVPSGQLIVTNGAASFGFAYTSISTVVGKTYQVSAGVVGASVSWLFRIGDDVGGASNTKLSTTGTTAGQTITGVFIATATTTYLRFGPNNSTLATTATIDNISVKELTGNHAALSGANTLRPRYLVSPARLVFDATDDRLLTTLNPTTSGTIAARLYGGTVSRVSLGSMAAADGRAFLALASDGALGAGIGTQSTSTIKGAVDIRSTWTTGIVTWNDTTVTLYQNGSSVYSAAQSGSVNTTVPFMLGCLNNNGTAASFWDGGIGAAIVLNRVMTASEVSSLTSYWSTIA